MLGYDFYLIKIINFAFRFFLIFQKVFNQSGLFFKHDGFFMISKEIMEIFFI